MRFRPCIDIHNGQVKQIVGGSLRDAGDYARENFIAEQNAAFYAKLYKEQGLSGGHIILLNSRDSVYYEETKRQALTALRAWPGGLQAGGGITPENAAEFLDAGASHVVVTSYVFKDGRIHYGRLKELVGTVGREHLVLDLSCRRRGNDYYVVTDRWQKFTRERVTPALLDALAQCASEFLIHAADVEGRASGIEEPLVKMLGGWNKIPVTYAGGVGGFEDLKRLKELGRGHVDVTIGSALDLFGGRMAFSEVLDYINEQ